MAGIQVSRVLGSEVQGSRFRVYRFIKTGGRITLTVRANGLPHLQQHESKVTFVKFHTSGLLSTNFDFLVLVLVLVLEIRILSGAVHEYENDDKYQIRSPAYALTPQI